MMLGTSPPIFNFWLLTYVENIGEIEESLPQMNFLFLPSMCILAILQ